MNLLIDTHTLLWWVGNSPRLGREARALMAGEGTGIWVSSVSIWEISIKASLGRMDRLPVFDKELMAELDRGDFHRLPITFEHAQAVGQLPLHHRDPFDRVLIAQARVENLTLLTADPAFTVYDVPTVDAAR